jgi:hypothetical protein
MCWFHLKMNVKKKKAELNLDDKYREIMNDIKSMHQSGLLNEYNQIWQEIKEKWLKYKLKKFVN